MLEIFAVEHDPNPHSTYLDVGFDSDYVTLTEGRPGEGPVWGYLSAHPEITFAARVSDQHGLYGVRGGWRIQSLIVSKGAKEVLTFTAGRGWINRRLTQEHADIVEQIRKGFPERTVRPPLPEYRPDFVRAALRLLGSNFRAQAQSNVRARERQFRQNAKDAGRSR